MRRSLDSYSDRAKRPRITLEAAVRKYWKHYLGLIFFLPLAWTLFRFIPSEGTAVMITMTLFFASGFYAGRPYSKYDAPYSFWILACGIWMGSGIIWIAVATIGGVIHGRIYG